MIHSLKSIRLAIALVAIGAFSPTICPLQAGELGHYLPGVASIRDFLVLISGIFDFSH